MGDGEFQEYLSTRYQQLINFYDKRAGQNKRGYRICSIFVIGVSGLLSPLIGTGILAEHKMIGALLSASVVIVSAILAHFQFNENWLSYRATWDALQRELYFRNAGLAEYQGSADRNATFVSKVEAIASREGSQWFGRHIRKEPGGGTGAHDATAAIGGGSSA